jgi:NB-ARC domain
VARSLAGRLRLLWRWSLAVVSFVGLFAGCWWAWEAWRLPPAGAGRLGVALAVATIISTASSGPLFWWAARDKPGAEAAHAARQVVIQPAGPVFGPNSDFRGAEFRFGEKLPHRARMTAGQVVAGEIPRKPPAFLTRKALRLLEEAAGPGKIAVVCALTGLRGVGKTQLAAAYARKRIRDGWRLVGWVNAQTQDSLLSGLARIADRLGLSDPDGDSLKSAQRLRDYLGSQQKSGLLVFDDASNPDRLRPFIPVSGGVQIVITSTDSAFADLGTSIEVLEFGSAESLKYLRKRTGIPDDSGARLIASELGGLPLALSATSVIMVYETAP